MTWATAPATFVVGAVLTAAQLNTEVRERMRYLKGTDGEIVLEDYLDFPSTAQGDVFYHNGTKLARLAAGTSGYLLRTLGAAADPVWAAVNTYAAGATALASSDGEVTGGGTSYVKVKAIKVGKNGTISTSFDIHKEADANHTSTQGRIYRSDVAAGTERSTTSVTYVNYTEDIVVVTGDIVELWIKGVGTNILNYAQNFRLTTDHSDTASARVIT